MFLKLMSNGFFFFLDYLSVLIEIGIILLLKPDFPDNLKKPNPLKICNLNFLSPDWLSGLFSISKMQLFSPFKKKAKKLLNHVIKKDVPNFKYLSSTICTNYLKCFHFSSG